MFGVKDAGLPEGRIVERSLAGNHLWMEQFDPFAIRCFGHLTGVAAIAAEQVEVARKVEVNRPLVALHVICGAASGFEVIAREEEVFALGILPVVPDGLAVETPELVACNLHVHRALVYERVVRAVGVDHPDAINLLPGAFVAVHQKVRVSRREKQMVDPVGGVKQNLHRAGPFAVGTGLEPDGEEYKRKMRGETAFHHLALAHGLIVRSLLVSSYTIVATAGRGEIGAVLLASVVAFNIGAGG